MGNRPYQWHAIIDVRPSWLVENLARVRVHEIPNQVIGVHHNNVVVVQSTPLQYLISVIHIRLMPAGDQSQHLHVQDMMEDEIQS